MSVSGAINFHINRNSRSITAVELIGFFEAGGWGLPFLGKICYLPLGDDDLFDWTYVPANEEHRELVLSIVEQKEEAGE